MDKGQLVASHQDQSMQQISSQFSDALQLNSFEPNGEIKVCPKFFNFACRADLFFFFVIQ